MIKILKSATADTRTCDVSKADKEELKEASISHMRDVYVGLDFFRDLLRERATLHDWDKIEGLDHFYSDFKTSFKEHGWYDNHKQVNRHHIDKEDGRREDINIVDVLEHIVDVVMAGMARSGSVYPVELPNEVLQSAVANTVDLLKSQVEVQE